MIIPFCKKESELLINLLSDKIPEEHLEKIERTLQEPLDWEYFMETALSHRITPIVYFNMKRYGLFEMVPDYLKMDMQRIYLESLARNLSCFEELKIILEKFKSANLNSLVLKGATLAQTIYEDNGLRIFSDIDILIARKDMEAINQTLEDLCYIVSEAYRPLDFYDKYHFHYIYLKESDFMTYALEMHWNLFSPYSPIQFGLKPLWENSIVIPMDETEVSTLNWDDHFLYICAHSVNHGVNSLLNVCDLMRITRKLNDDSWNDIENKARNWGIEKAVECCMQILKNMFGETIPYPGLLLKRPQIFFANSMCSAKNLVRPDWSFAPLARLLFFKQNKKEFIRTHLFPNEENELYKYCYNLPKKITLSKRIIFFLKGVKSLTHIVWSFTKICFYQIWH